jgi:hypothetical protein
VATKVGADVEVATQGEDSKAAGEEPIGHHESHLKEIPKE